MSKLAWGTLGSPVGEISVACSAAGVAKVRFGPPPAQPGQAHGRLAGTEPTSDKAGPSPAGAEHQVNRARAQLTEYFDGQRRAFDQPVDRSGNSPSHPQNLPVLWATCCHVDSKP